MNTISTRLYRAILIVLAVGLLTLPFSITAEEIYRHVDEDGNVTYTDNPPDDDSKPMDLAPLPEMNLPDRPDQSGSSASGEEQNKDSQKDSYEKVTITQPENDSAFWRGGGLVNINAGSEPELRQGHAYELEFDGERRMRSSSGTFTLNNINRGTHEIRVHIIDKQGETIESSDLTRFTLHRPSRRN